MRRVIPVLSHADDVVRHVCVSLIAISVTALAMGIRGRQVSRVTLAATIAVMAAVLVFQVWRSVTYYRNKSDAVRRAARRAEEHYAEVLRRIVKFVEARDEYIVGHSQRVGDLSRKIAVNIGLPVDQVNLLQWAGELHDIGLLAVPADVLAKPTHIGAAEFRSVKQHAEAAYEILKPLSFLEDVLPAIHHHHERMNGTGYPGGLVGEQIPLNARVLAVADAYDAMTHDRPHRAAMTPLQALRELKRCTPAGYFEPCVNALAEIMNMPDLEMAAPQGPRVAAATA